MTDRSAFAIASRDEGSTTVVAVAGELDVHTAPELEAALEAAPARARIVVDCTAVGFMDSTGLSVFVAAQERARGGGGGLGVVIAEPSVRKVFSITGVDEVVPVHETLAGALATA